MRNETKVVLCFLTISALLGFTQVPIVSATSSTPNVFEILSYGGDITFIGGGTMTKMVVVGPDSFTSKTSEGFTFAGFASFLSFPPGSFPLAASPVDIPNGATITGFECIVKTIPTGGVLCYLREGDHGVTAGTQIAFLIENADGDQTVDAGVLNFPVDRNNHRYTVFFETTGSCGGSINCGLYSAKITYTIPSGMVVGGEFYPVDNVSLILAYGLVNSWWMAPIGIGIGVGVYLVKRRF